MEYAFKNLIFEGGGVKGIAYVGALDVLEKRGIVSRISRVGGASAGAINAVLLALDYNLDEMRTVLKSLDFTSFLDDSWGMVRDTNRLINEFGWYKGKFFSNWIGRRIEEKTGTPHSTFNELKNKGFRDLYIIGTNLSTGFAEVFSVEHTPRMRVADAVRISMSIPLFFAAIKNVREDVYVDGGVMCNYPIKLFDREKYIARKDRATSARKTAYYKTENQKIPQTSSRYVYNKESLGFRLDSGNEITRFRDGAEPQTVAINDFFDYVAALMKALLSAQDSTLHLHTDDWHRTVYIDTRDVSFIDFHLSDDKKGRLETHGRKGTEAYFDWFDKNEPGNEPINHPENDL